MFNQGNRAPKKRPYNGGDQRAFQVSDTGGKSDIGKQQPRRFAPEREAFKEKDQQKQLEEDTHRAMMFRQQLKARDAWGEKIRRETALPINEIHSNHFSKGDSLSDRSISPSDHTKSSLDPVRQSALEQMRKLQNNLESVLAYRREGKVYVTDDVSKAEKEFGKKTIDNLNTLGLGRVSEGVRSIHLADAIIGVERFGLEPRVDITTPQVEKHQDAKSDARETKSLFEAKPDKKRVTFAPNLEEVRFFNKVEEFPIGPDNHWPKTLITDDQDAYDHIVRNIGYEPLNGYEKKRYQKVSDFVDPSQIPEDRKWTLGYNLEDFKEFYDPDKPLEREDFTKNFQDTLRGHEVIHEGEYSAREKRAHGKLIGLMDRKLRERLGFVAQGHLGSSELRIDSTEIAKIRFYAYENRRGDLLFTNAKYTDQDCANRDLKRVSLDYAVEKLAYLEDQGAVKWKLPQAYAIKSESNAIGTYDKNLAEHIMANEGYKELMPGTREGIDLSDPDDQEVDEAFSLAQSRSMDSIMDRPLDKEALAKMEEDFDQSPDGKALTKKKMQLDRFIKMLRGKFNKEEEGRITELEDNYDVARGNIIAALYNQQVRGEERLWEYNMLYKEAVEQVRLLEKALNDKGKEYYRSSLKNHEKRPDILGLEDKFEETKNRLKPNSNFSEDIKALSMELAKEHRQYIEARLETEEPNEKSNQALERIQKHLEKSIEDMNAVEEALS